MRSLLVAAVLLAASDTPSLELPARLERLLENGRWDATPPSFRMIALSHLADGCAGQARAHPEFALEARACVEAALRSGGRHTANTFSFALGGVVGFREWPRGVERQGDVDSGPIVFGIGTAASAFGIAAAKTQGDMVLAAELEASASAVMMTGVGGAVAQSILAQAISFQGRWQ